MKKGLNAGLGFVMMHGYLDKIIFNRKGNKIAGVKYIKGNNN